MILLKQPNKWSCSVTALAMALGDHYVDSIINCIGHDGSQILWPDFPDPLRRRGFHIQELVDVAVRRGYAATEIEAWPVSTPARTTPGHDVMGENKLLRFRGYLANFQGVVIGRGLACEHAVFCDHGEIFDPNGQRYDIDGCEANNFDPKLFLFLTKFHS